MRYYSKSTGCTYLEGVHTEIPVDAVEISEDRYLSVLANPSLGKVRSHDADGLPILIEPPVYELTQDDLRAIVASRRYQAETAGIDIAGIAIDTGRDSQALITGAALAAMLDHDYACRWKTPAGFVEMNSEQIINVASAVRAHVQACFDREAWLLQAIEDGTYGGTMLEDGWPNGQVPHPLQVEL